MKLFFNFILIPRLTQRRLQLLNRSQSKRDVFDEYESVPLLPEVSGHHVQLTSNVKHRLSETVDKGTQTSVRLASEALKVNILIKPFTTYTGATRVDLIWIYAGSFLIEMTQRI